MVPLLSSIGKTVIASWVSPEAESIKTVFTSTFANFTGLTPVTNNLLVEVASDTSDLKLEPSDDSKGVLSICHQMFKDDVWSTSPTTTNVCGSYDANASNSIFVEYVNVSQTNTNSSNKYFETTNETITYKEELYKKFVGCSETDNCGYTLEQKSEAMVEKKEHGGKDTISRQWGITKVSSDNSSPNSSTTTLYSNWELDYEMNNKVIQLQNDDTSQGSDTNSQFTQNSIPNIIKFQIKPGGSGGDSDQTFESLENFVGKTSTTTGKTTTDQGSRVQIGIGKRELGAVRFRKKFKDTKSCFDGNKWKTDDSTVCQDGDFYVKKSHNLDIGLLTDNVSKTTIENGKLNVSGIQVGCFKDHKDYCEDIQGVGDEMVFSYSWKDLVCFDCTAEAQTKSQNKTKTPTKRKGAFYRQYGVNDQDSCTADETSNFSVSQQNTITKISKFKGFLCSESKYSAMATLWSITPYTSMTNATPNQQYKLHGDDKLKINIASLNTKKGTQRFDSERRKQKYKTGKIVVEIDHKTGDKTVSKQTNHKLQQYLKTQSDGTSENQTIDNPKVIYHLVYLRQQEKKKVHAITGLETEDNKAHFIMEMDFYEWSAFYYSFGDKTPTYTSDSPEIVILFQTTNGYMKETFKNYFKDNIQKQFKTSTGVPMYSRFENFYMRWRALLEDFKENKPTPWKNGTSPINEKTKFKLYLQVEPKATFIKKPQCSTFKNTINSTTVVVDGKTENWSPWFTDKHLNVDKLQKLPGSLNYAMLVIAYYNYDQEKNTLSISFKHFGGGSNELCDNRE